VSSLGDVYSPTLAATMALLVGTVVCMISARISSSTHLTRLAYIGIGLAFFALGLSVTSHVALGHGPGTPEALGVIGFIANHPIVPVLLLATLALLFLLRRSARG